MVTKFFTGMILYTGKKGVEFSTTATAMVGLFVDVLDGMFREKQIQLTSFVSQLSRQILYTGVEAFWLVGIVALLCGITIVIQAMTNMPRFGVGEYFGNILVIAVVRELGPFFTCFVVIGRSGAALAAHIGTMRVNKEVAALEVMGVDPVHFLVTPAFVGMIASMICLNVYFDIIAIIGGLTFAKFTVHVPFGLFLMKVVAALNYQDILISISKSFVFGGIIAIVACHYGLAVKNIRGVPQAAIKAVVGSMAVTILLNIVVTIGFYAR